MKIRLVKEIIVEAAHRNPRGGPAQQRLHGHSYRIEVLAEGAPDPRAGWIVDFAELKVLMRSVCAQLDHACLNDLPGLEDDASLPALEHWILDRIGPKPAWFAGVRVRITGDCAFVPVHLPEDTDAGLPARVRFTFEAAQSLPGLPEGHPCRKLHGHSYRVEAGARDLDALVPHLAGLYEAFDHRYLNELPGLEQATVETLCGHVWRWLEERGAAPTVVAVQETPSSRGIYFGEG